MERTIAADAEAASLLGQQYARACAILPSTAYRHIGPPKVPATALLDEALTALNARIGSLILALKHEAGTNRDRSIATVQDLLNEDSSAASDITKLENAVLAARPSPVP